MWSLWLCLLVCQVAGLLVCAGRARAEEPVSLRADLTEGMTLRYEAEARLQVKSDRASQTVDQRLVLRFTVAKADKDGTLVRGRLESVKVRSDVNGETQEFAWTEGEGPGAEQEGGLAGLYRQLGGAVFEIALDASGTVDSVTGLERTRDEARDVSNASRLMGILAPDAAPRMLQGVFAIDTEGKKRSPGDSWRSTQEFNAGIWKAKARTDYTLKSLTGGVAKVTGATVILPPPASEGDGQRPASAIASQSVTTDATWDVAKGRLLTRTTDGTVVYKATLPLKEPIEATSTSISHIAFRLLGEDAPPKPPR